MCTVSRPSSVGLGRQRNEASAGLPPSVHATVALSTLGFDAGFSLWTGHLPVPEWSQNDKVGPYAMFSVCPCYLVQGVWEEEGVVEGPA